MRLKEIIRAAVLGSRKSGQDICLLTLTGEESWLASGTASVQLRLDREGRQQAAANGAVACSLFPVGASDTGTPCFYVSTSGVSMFIYYIFTYPPDGVTGLDSWKAWLAAQYAAGTPLRVWYRLPTDAVDTEENRRKYMAEFLLQNKEE